MYKYFVLLTFFLCFGLNAQTTKEDSTKALVKQYGWDTLKYHKFDYVLIVGLYQQHRNFNLTFQQLINTDTILSSLQTYGAESGNIGGIVLNYDKFLISFGVRNTPQDPGAKKGFTKAFNIGLSVGDNRWVLESYYRSFKGFYNKNTPSWDSANFNKTKEYFLQPGLTSKIFMNRIMYFTNHQNFSYKSGFGCDYRQLRSSATWILGASFNIFDLHNDSAFFPAKARPLYNDYGRMQSFRSYNVAINVGAAATLVLFKAWFISGYFTAGPEQQWRNYNLGEGNFRHLSYIGFSGTGRIALGVNLRKFYLLYAFTDDYNIYDSFGVVAFKSESITNNVTFGWRFHTGMPKFYKKIQQTKFYKFI